MEYFKLVLNGIRMINFNFDHVEFFSTEVDYVCPELEQTNPSISLTSYRDDKNLKTSILEGHDRFAFYGIEIFTQWFLILRRNDVIR